MKKEESAGRNSLGAARSVALTSADLTIRRTEMVKADLVGLARVAVYEGQVVGKISIVNPRPAL